MYKGEVAVILYDEKGNEVHRQEKHNLVTNATADMIKMVGGGSGSSNNLMNSMMPIAEKALGGLVLFDGLLTESADNINIPSSVKVVACAGRNQDGTNVNAGSLNVSETTKIQGGYQTVWDFSTSQANKSIASLALTSDYAGDNIFDAYCGNEALLKSCSATVNPIKNTNGVAIHPNNIFPLKYDRTTQTFYFLQYKGYESNEHHYVVSYARVPLFEYEVADSFYEVGIAYDSSATIASNTVLDFTKGSVDVKGGYAYVPKEIASGATNVTFYKIALSNFSTTLMDAINITLGPSGYVRIVVSDGYLYSLVDGAVHRVNVTDPNITYTYNLRQDTTNLVSPATHNIVNTADGFVMCVTSYISGTNKNYALYRDAGNSAIAIKPTNRSTAIQTIPFNNGMVTIYVESSVLKFCVKRDYLGTIFNLQTPVNKTQATSMKVIYTLTNV